MRALLVNKKTSTVVLSIAYAAVNVVFVHSAESRFWEDRRKARAAGDWQARLPGPAVLGSSLPRVSPLDSSATPIVRADRLPRGLSAEHRRWLTALPESRVSLRRITLPAGTPRGLVIHLQDVHHNTEAQRNLGDALARVLAVAGDRAPAVALEGAFGPIRLDHPRAFPDRDALRTASEEMLQQNEISGPVHALLNAVGPAPALLGIDDPDHYKANADAYRRARPGLPAEKERLARARVALEAAKAATYNPALRAFDNNVRAYHDGKSRLGDYARALGPRPSKDAPTLNAFLETLAMEESLDYARVEAERGRLLDALARSLTAPALERLTAHGIAYRAGEISAGDFYTALNDLCRGAAINLEQTPAFAAYIRYVLRAQRIDADRLFDELRARERAVYERLFATAAERRLWEESARLGLEEKLADFSLSPEEWKALQQHGAARSPVLADAARFYAEAHARDAAMADRLLGSLSDRPGAVLVTGGYHARGLAERLVHAGYAVAAAVPKLTRVDGPQGADYLSVFAREKTPLDKLFDGPALFLAAPPASDQGLARTELTAGAVSVEKSPEGVLPEPVREHLGKKFTVIDGGRKNGVGTVRVRRKGRTIVASFDPTRPGGRRARWGMIGRARLTPDDLRRMAGRLAAGARRLLRGTRGAPAPVEVLDNRAVRRLDVRTVFIDFDLTIWAGYPFDTQAAFFVDRLFGGDPVKRGPMTRLLKRVSGLSEADKIAAFRADRTLGFPEMDAAAWTAIYRDVRARVKAHIETHFDPRLVPGVRDFLREIRATGRPVYVLTGGNAEECRARAERLGVASLIDGYYGDGDKAARLAALLKEKGLAPSSVILVGDAPSDMEAARANGVLGVGLASEPEDEGPLGGAGAGVLVRRSFSDLGRLLRVLNMDPPPAIFPARAGLRTAVGTYAPLFQIRSERDWGIGDFGTALETVDLHKALGLSLVQIEPLNLSSAGHSPYSVASSRAIEPNRIDVEAAVARWAPEGETASWIAAPETRRRITALRASPRVRYGEVDDLKRDALGRLWSEVRDDPQVRAAMATFRRDNDGWVNDHLLYVVLKRHFLEGSGVDEKGRPLWDWRNWPAGLRDRDSTALRRARIQHREALAFETFLQFLAADQRRDFVDGARRRGVEIMVDIPFALDGADLWIHPEVFGLKRNEGYRRSVTQGVPPEPAYPAGQYWQFYPFDWTRAESAQFIEDLLRFNQQWASCVRLDHVLGYYRAYLFSEDGDGRLTLEKLGLYRPMRDAQEKGRAGGDDAKRDAVAAVARLMKEKFQSLAARPSSDNPLPPSLRTALFAPDGDWAPDAALIAARAADGAPPGNGWGRQYVVEQAVFTGRSQWDFLRLTPRSDGSDGGFLWDYLFGAGGDVRAGDSLRPAAFARAPGEEILARLLAVAQEKGTQLVWETLGTVPAGVPESVRRLGGTDYIPVIYGENPNSLYHPSRHVPNAYVTLGLHDSTTLRHRWENEWSDGDRRHLWGLMRPDRAPPADLRPFTPEIRDGLISLIMKSPARIAALTWTDLLGLGEEHRINAPGVQDGQWTGRWPYTVEEMARALASGDASHPAFDALHALPRLLADGGRNPAAPTPGLLRTDPETDGEMLQLRPVGQPFVIDAFVYQAVGPPRVRIVDAAGDTAASFALERSGDSGAGWGGTPIGITQWRGAWAARRPGDYTFSIESNGRTSPSGRLRAVPPGADLNPLSPSYGKSKEPRVIPWARHMGAAFLGAVLWTVSFSPPQAAERKIYSGGAWSVLGTEDTGPAARKIRTPEGEFSELKVLHNDVQIGTVKGNGYYRLAPSGTVWGTSFVTPSYWAAGQRHISSVTDLSFSFDDAGRLTLAGTIDAPHWRADDFTMTFLAPNVREKIEARVAYSLKAKMDFAFDPGRIQNGESLKWAQFSSMNIGTDWDADVVVHSRGEATLQRGRGWVFDRPVPILENQDVQLTNNNTARPRETPTTYVRLMTGGVSFVAQGWITPSKDPNDDNVGFWIAPPALISPRAGELILPRVEILVGARPPETTRLPAPPEPAPSTKSPDPADSGGSWLPLDWEWRGLPLGRWYALYVAGGVEGAGLLFAVAHITAAVAGLWAPDLPSGLWVELATAFGTGGLAWAAFRYLHWPFHPDALVGSPVHRLGAVMFFAGLFAGFPLSDSWVGDVLFYALLAAVSVHHYAENAEVVGGVSPAGRWGARWLKSAPPAPRVLSLGANGIDETHLLLSRPDVRLNGITLSREDLDRAMETARTSGVDGRAQYALQDMRDGLPMEDGAVQLVHARLSLHYLSRDEAAAAFAEIRRVLSAEGRAVIVVKSDRDFWARHSSARLDPATGLTTYTESTPAGDRPVRRRFFSEEELLRSLAAAGLSPSGPVRRSQAFLYSDPHPSDLLTVVVRPGRTGPGIDPVRADAPSPSARRFLSMITEGEKRPLLSIGIGNGDEAFFARTTHRRVLGITLKDDYLGKSVAAARAAGVEGLTDFRLADVRNALAVLAEDSIGDAYARLSLQYLPQPDLEKVLAQLRRVLKTNGKMMIVVRSDADPQVEGASPPDPVTGFRRHRTRSGQVKERQFFSEEQLKQMAARHGFDSVVLEVLNERLPGDDHESRLLSAVFVKSPPAPPTPLPFDLHRAGEVDAKFARPAHGISWQVGMPFEGALQERLLSLIRGSSEILGGAVQSYAGHTHITLANLLMKNDGPVTAADVEALKLDGIQDALAGPVEGSVRFERVRVNPDGFVVLEGSLAGPLVAARENLRRLGYFLHGADRVHVTLLHAPVATLRGLSAEKTKHLLDWAAAETERLQREPLTLDISAAGFVFFQTYGGANSLARSDPPLPLSGGQNVKEELRRLLARSEWVRSGRSEPIQILRTWTSGADPRWGTWQILPANTSAVLHAYVESFGGPISQFEMKVRVGEVEEWGGAWKNAKEFSMTDPQKGAYWRNGEGFFSTRLQFPPGRYEYEFLLRESSIGPWVEEKGDARIHRLWSTAEGPRFAMRQKFVPIRLGQRSTWQARRLSDWVGAGFLNAAGDRAAGVSLRALKDIVYYAVENAQQHGRPDAPAFVDAWLDGDLLRVEVRNPTDLALPSEIDGEFRLDAPNPPVPPGKRGPGSRHGDAVSRVKNLVSKLYPNSATGALLSPRVRWSWRRDSATGEVVFHLALPAPKPEGVPASSFAADLAGETQIVPFTRENVRRYEADLLAMERGRAGGWRTISRFLEDARAATGLPLEGKWDFSFLAVDGGHAVGYLIGIRPNPDKPYAREDLVLRGRTADKGLVIFRAGVLEAARGRGVGRRLWGALAAAARAAGVEFIYQDARIDNTRARDLYRRLGFVDLSGFTDDTKNVDYMAMVASVEDLLAATRPIGSPASVKASLRSATVASSAVRIRYFHHQSSAPPLPTVSGYTGLPLRRHVPSGLVRGEMHVFDPHHFEFELAGDTAVATRDLDTNPLGDDDPHSGRSLFEWFLSVQTRSQPSVFALFCATQGHYWLPNTLTVENRRPIMRARVPGLDQTGTSYQPPHGIFSVLSLDPQGKHIWRNVLQEGRRWREIDGFPKRGIGGPVLIEDGKSVVQSLLFNQKPALSGNALDWVDSQMGKAMTGIGRTREGKIVIVQLFEGQGLATPDLGNLVDALLEHDVESAILGGSSADVQRFFPWTGDWAVSTARPDSVFQRRVRTTRDGVETRKLGQVLVVRQRPSLFSAGKPVGAGAVRQLAAWSGFAILANWVERYLAWMGGILWARPPGRGGLPADRVARGVDLARDIDRALSMGRYDRLSGLAGALRRELLVLGAGPKGLLAVLREALDSAELASAQLAPEAARRSLDEKAVFALFEAAEASLLEGNTEKAASALDALAAVRPGLLTKEAQYHKTLSLALAAQRNEPGALTRLHQTVAHRLADGLLGWTEESFHARFLRRVAGLEDASPAVPLLLSALTEAPGADPAALRRLLKEALASNENLSRLAGKARRAGIDAAEWQRWSDRLGPLKESLTDGAPRGVRVVPGLLATGSMGTILADWLERYLTWIGGILWARPPPAGFPRAMPGAGDPRTAPLGRVAMVNLMDAGSRVEGGGFVTERGLAKTARLFPLLARRGFKQVYLYNGLYELSALGEIIHRDSGTEPRLFKSGPAQVRVAGYTPKREERGGLLYQDHGNNFSINSMETLNPAVVDGSSNEERWRRFAEVVSAARREGLGVVVDLNPWIAPDALTPETALWAEEHRRVDGADRILSDEDLLAKPENADFALVTFGEDRILVKNCFPGKDQMKPDPRHPGYFAYLERSLRRLIDAGVTGVRVDMAGDLTVSQVGVDWEVWGRLIENARRYAESKGQKIHFIMEAFKDNWPERFLERYPDNYVYHAAPFHIYRALAQGDRAALSELRREMDDVLRRRKGQYVVYPTNFDEPSLRALGGPTAAFVAMLLTYERLGVPLLLDARELMGEEGQNIPQAGGERRDENGRFQHPFSNPPRQNWREFRRRLEKEDPLGVGAWAAELDAATNVEVLETEDPARYFAVGLTGEDGSETLRVFDFFPEDSPRPIWISAPRSVADKVDSWGGTLLPHVRDPHRAARRPGDSIDSPGRWRSSVTHGRRSYRLEDVRAAGGATLRIEADARMTRRYDRSPYAFVQGLNNTYNHWSRDASEKAAGTRPHTPQEAADVDGASMPRMMHQATKALDRLVGSWGDNAVLFVGGVGVDPRLKDVARGAALRLKNSRLRPRAGGWDALNWLHGVSNGETQALLHRMPWEDYRDIPEGLPRDHRVVIEDGPVHRYVATLQTRGYVFLPGNLGKWNILMDLLVQMQTGKIPRRPVVLVDRARWKPFVDAFFQNALPPNTYAPKGFVAAEDRDLIQMVDTPEEVLRALGAEPLDLPENVDLRGVYQGAPVAEPFAWIARDPSRPGAPEAVAHESEGSLEGLMKAVHWLLSPNDESVKADALNRALATGDLVSHAGRVLRNTVAGVPALAPVERRVADILAEPAPGLLLTHRYDQWNRLVSLATQLEPLVPRRADFRTAMVNLMDIGSHLRGGKMATDRGLAKAERLLPLLADTGMTDVYIHNGLYQPSSAGVVVHTQSTAEPNLLKFGNATVYVQGYVPKRLTVDVDGRPVELRDDFGNNYSVDDMARLNPAVVDGNSDEDRWASLASFTAAARRKGMTVTADLIPWLSPAGMTYDRLEWASEAIRVEGELAGQTDQALLETHRDHVLLTFPEGRFLVRRYMGVDQVRPDFTNPRYFAYLEDHLKRLIDAGVSRARVDMAHDLIDPARDPRWRLWTTLISGAKAYAARRGRSFHFLMEAYGPWAVEFLRRFPEEQVYHVNPHHNYRRVAAGKDPRALPDLLAALNYARDQQKGRFVAFPTNFDMPSLVNLGGPAEAFLKLLLVYERMGVPLMVDLREMLGEEGQNIPQAGGQEIINGNFGHPFLRAPRRGYRGLLRLIGARPSPSTIIREWREMLRGAAAVEILESNDPARFVTVRITNKDGWHRVEDLDFAPQAGPSGTDRWVRWAGGAARLAAVAAPAVGILLVGTFLPGAAWAAEAAAGVGLMETVAMVALAWVGLSVVFVLMVARAVGRGKRGEWVESVFLSPLPWGKIVETFLAGAAWVHDAASAARFLKRAGDVLRLIGPDGLTARERLRVQFAVQDLRELFAGKRDRSDALEEFHQILVRPAPSTPPAWLALAAARDAALVAEAVRGSAINFETAFRLEGRDLSLKLNEFLPFEGNLDIQSLDGRSGGAEFLTRLAPVLSQNDYRHPFESALRRELNQKPEPLPPLELQLHRLRQMALGESTRAPLGPGVPAQLDICDWNDRITVKDTVERVRALNVRAEVPVRLILAGADSSTVEYLRRLIGADPNMAVLDRPVADRGTLDLRVLGDSFKRLAGRPGWDSPFALAVSVSEGLASTLRSSAMGSASLPDVLREALVKFFESMPLRPVDFNSQIRILSILAQNA